jgi:hypothetical protein
LWRCGGEARAEAGRRGTGEGVERLFNPFFAELPEPILNILVVRDFV